MIHGKKVFFLLLAVLTAEAQTKIEKTIPTTGARAIKLDLEYPQATISTWNRNEVQIRGTVSINYGESDEAFELLTSLEGNQLIISSSFGDKEKISKRVTIKKGETTHYFKATSVSDPEVQKFLEENGREYSYMSIGIITDIRLEILIPEGLATEVNARYGLLEVKGFNAPLKIISKYGNVDATLTKSKVGELVVKSRYGEILSNLDIQFEQPPFEKAGKNHWTEISAKPGSGPSCSIEAKYGKVYLRKPQ